MRKELYKSSVNKRFMGVCQGLADYFDISVNIVRAIFLILALAGSGLGILVYFALGIFLPYDYQVQGQAGPGNKRPGGQSYSYTNPFNRNQEQARKDVTPEDEDHWSDF
ncbi:PspC domain-containing protein [Hutsoniella sourekii]